MINPFKVFQKKAKANTKEENIRHSPANFQPCDVLPSNITYKYQKGKHIWIAKEKLSNGYKYFGIWMKNDKEDKLKCLERNVKRVA